MTPASTWRSGAYASSPAGTGSGRTTTVSAMGTTSVTFQPSRRMIA
jgi:hypothetical protein